MKNALLAALLLAAPLSAAAKIRVVATTPELADVVARVGGARVAVDALARGTEDIHQVVMRPSFVSKLNRADAVVFLGLGVEHSFLPGLLDVARNPRMRTDPDTSNCMGPACVDCSAGIRVLQKPASISRVEGDQHPQGNPHYNLSPANGPVIARNVAEGLARVDPEGAEDYKKGLKAYLDELEPEIAALRKRAAPLKGLKAVSYHQDMPYLGDFTGLEFVGTIEAKPGVAPTPSHLAALVEEMKAKGVKLIVREQQYDAKTADWVAERAGAKVAVVGTMAGALPDSATFAKFSERNVEALLKALETK